MRQAYYTIVQKPVEIQFECPYCEAQNEIEFEKFIDRYSLDDEYGVWTNHIDEVKCDYCGDPIIFESVEVD